MVTNVVMESTENRSLTLGSENLVVRQRTSDSYFSFKDTRRAIFLFSENRYIVDDYFKLKSSKEFIEALRVKKNCEPKKRGRKGVSEGWIHPLLFIDILLWANPSFKVEVYDWLYDHLIQSRIDSSDSFRLMAGALYETTARKDKYSKLIANTSFRIKQLIGVDEWNKASEEQLKKRDEINKFIADLAVTLQNADEAVRLSFVNFERKWLQ